MKTFSNSKKSGFIFSAVIFSSIIIQLALSIVWIIYATATDAKIDEFSFGYTIFSQFVLPVALLTVVFFIIKLFKDKPKEVFCAAKTSSVNVLSAIIFGFLIYFVSALAGGLFQLFWQAVGTVPSLNLPAVNNIGRLIAFIAVFAVLPAISEEFIYRGAIFHYSQKGGKGFAIIFSSLCFAFMHMNFYQLGYAFVAGIIFALFMFATKDIWFIVIMHFVNNLISIIYMYMQDGLNISFSLNILGLTVFETIMAFVALAVFAAYFIIIKKVKFKRADSEEKVSGSGGEAVHAQFALSGNQQPALIKEKKADAFKISLIGFITCLFMAILALM